MTCDNLGRLFSVFCDMWYNYYMFNRGGRPAHSSRLARCRQGRGSMRHMSANVCRSRAAVTDDAPEFWEDSMSTQPGRTVEIARRHLHDVLRMGTSDLRAPMLDWVESWNWAVRISVVGLFVLERAAFSTAWRA